jgi:hypothetical protein
MPLAEQTLGLGVAALLALVGSALPAAPDKLASLKTSELIDRLTQLSTEGIAT